MHNNELSLHVCVVRVIFVANCWFRVKQICSFSRVYFSSEFSTPAVVFKHKLSDQSTKKLRDVISQCGSLFMNNWDQSAASAQREMLFKNVYLGTTKGH